MKNLWRSGQAIRRARDPSTSHAPRAALRMTTVVGGGNRPPVATQCHRVPCPTCAGSRLPSSPKRKAQRPVVILSGTPAGSGAEGSQALGACSPASSRSFGSAPEGASLRMTTFLGGGYRTLVAVVPGDRCAVPAQRWGLLYYTGRYGPSGAGRAWWRRHGGGGPPSATGVERTNPVMPFMGTQVS